MMDDLFRQALESENLSPISDPEVDIVAPEPLEFKVTVEVFPTVELGDYAGVRVETRDIELTDDDVDEVIETVLRNRSEWVELETSRAPLDGEQVTIDLAIFEGDEQFQEPATDAEFVLGEAGLFEAIAEAIKLMQPGTSSELTLAFDDDDVSVRPELRGKTLRYQITLKNVKQRKLPELDDAFVEELGRYPDVDTFRRAVRRDTLYGRAQEARAEVLNEAIEGMVATSTVDIPARMVESELDDEVNQMRTRLAQQGVSLDDYLAAQSQTLEELRAELAENAESRIRNTLVLSEIAKAEGVEVTDEDIEAEIERVSANAADPERMRQIYATDYFRNMLESELSDRKMTDRILEIATDGRGPLSDEGATLLEEGPELPEMRELLQRLEEEERARIDAEVDAELAAEGVVIEAAGETVDEIGDDEADEAPVDVAEDEGSDDEDAEIAVADEDDENTR
jgi:trigger factor